MYEREEEEEEEEEEVREKKEVFVLDKLRGDDKRQKARQDKTRQDGVTCLTYLGKVDKVGTSLDSHLPCKRLQARATNGREPPRR